MVTAGCPSDLSDEEWALIKLHMPAGKGGGKPKTTDLRQIVCLNPKNHPLWSLPTVTRGSFEFFPDPPATTAASYKIARGAGYSPTLFRFPVTVFPLP